MGSGIGARLKRRVYIGYTYEEGIYKVFICLYIHIYTYVSEKAMAPHSSTLAWKIPWTEDPGGLQFMGSLRVGHD